MSKTVLKLLLGSVLLIAIQACAPSVPATPDQNSINTAIAQTLAAVQPQTTQPGIPVTGDESPTPSLTTAPTATAIVLPSPALMTSTPAVSPGVTQISVSVATNCRVGPGTAYERVGALLVGETAEVVGRHDVRDYWVIRNPDRPGETCWLWGQYATLTGNTDVLPILTPPSSPTPTATAAPGFIASYGGLESCTNIGWWVDIELDNAGGTDFTSISMVVEDTVTTTARALHSDSFTNRNGCDETDTRDTLPAGAALRVSSPAFMTDLSGHRLRTTIILCSGPGQSGTCVTRAIEFTP
jgi:hypothetical protein